MICFCKFIKEDQIKATVTSNKSKLCLHCFFEKTKHWEITDCKYIVQAEWIITLKFVIERVIPVRILVYGNKQKNQPELN